MHGGEVLKRSGGERAVELAQGLRRRERLCALDHPALELAAQVALELAQAVERHAVRIGQLGVRRGLPLQPERAADALHVDSDHAGAFALAAEGGDGKPGHVPHLSVRALADGVGDLPAQLVEVETLPALEALLPEPALHGLPLDRAEEETLEEQLEHVAVLLRLRERCRQRLAEVLLLGPGDLAEGLEGV